MSRRRRLWVALALVVAVIVAAVGSAVVVSHNRHGHGGAAVPLPTSMASAGDSITRAFDVDDAHFLTAAPGASWATGEEPSVGSHYLRIRSAQPAITGHTFNVADTGAVMSGLDGQVMAAAGQRVQYLTILIGANDLCTQSVDTMTTTATFTAQFARALSDFFGADPTAHVLVSSIPNIGQLWNTMHTNLRAEAAWALARVCQSMLALSNTGVQRQQVAAQELADNAALAAVCATYRNCRSDGNAVYRAKFPPSDVSTVDYFHPSLAGQAALAATTWAAGYWPATP